MFDVQLPHVSLALAGQLLRMLHIEPDRHALPRPAPSTEPSHFFNHNPLHHHHFLHPPQPHLLTTLPHISLPGCRLPLPLLLNGNDKDDHLGTVMRPDLSPSLSLNDNDEMRLVSPPSLNHSDKTRLVSPPLH